VGFPGSTIDVPGPARPDLADLVRRIPHDPFGHRASLADALDGGVTQEPGHLCVTAWVRRDGGRELLLVRHPRLGWATPGGHVERDESPARAVARELREETGLELAPTSVVPVVLHSQPFPAGPSGPAHWHHNLGYVFAADGLDDSGLVAEPGAPVRWFSLERLPEPRVPDLLVIAPLLSA